VELALEKRAYCYKQPPSDPQTPLASFSPFKALLASLSPYHLLQKKQAIYASL
jgi:hypothetical protein